MGLIIIIAVIAIIIGMYLSPAFRTGIATAAENVMVIAFGVARQYALFAAVTVAVMSFWMFLALMIGNPIFSGIVFLVAITMFFIVWLPLGIVLRIFGANATVVPPAVRSLFALMAFIGFLAVMAPDIFTLKTVLIASLVAVLFATVSSKVDALGKLLMPIVIVMCVLAVWQNVAPDSFRASDRHRKAIGALFTTGNDRGAFRKETRAASTFGKVVIQTPIVYEATINPAGEITKLTEVAKPQKAGAIVLLYNQKDEVKLFQGQSFTRVVLPNKYGTYVNGEAYWLESNRLDIGTLADFTPFENFRDNSASNNGVVMLALGTQVFHLPNVGDETPMLKYPDCIKLGSKISSADYGYEIEFSELEKYPGGENVFIPKKKNPQFKLRATKPNQYITATVWQQ